LESTFPEGDRADTDAVEKCINEVASIDPSGEALRYGRKKQKQGGGTTWSNPVQINLANTRDVMNGLSAFLDGSYEAMSELLQCQSDMDADLDSEWSES
jgi:hypothetical protein